MDFTNKIQTLRSKAQETQAANKIIDMLKHIESKNDKATSYRWIWELIQNAKDVANSSGIVDIVINFDEQNKIIEFKHNGKLFSTKNIIFLIEQVSTKERGKLENKIKKTTGKFGTGFLTTHLLSKKVNVSGYLQDDDDNDDIAYSFNIDLDRSSNDQNTIIRSIEESCIQLDKNSTKVNGIINEDDFNTCFTYSLDNNGIKTAKNGLNNLIVSAPYVFAFVPEINSITVSATLSDRKYHQTIVRGETKSSNLENATSMSVNVTTNGKKDERFIFVLTDSEETNLAIAVEVDIQNGDRFIKSANQYLPKLFCDFPLLGTDDFSFPVVINSSAFNPTEPRDGIYLTDKEFDDEEPLDIKENKDTIVKATELYIKLLDYFLCQNYKAIYNITKISEPPVKEWLSEDWLNNKIIDRLKSHIKEVDLIDTHGGMRRPLQDDWGMDSVLIPNYTNENIRLNLWKISSKFVPDMLPKYEELECWYNSLWDERHNYSVEDLIKKVESFKNVATLNNQINVEVFTWLNEFYDLVYSTEHGFASKLNIEPCIVPNQNGEFCSLSTLFYDYNIEEKYKELSLLLDLDLKVKLIDKRVATNLSQKKFVRKFKFDDMVSEFQKQLKSDSLATEEFYRKILCLKFQDIEKQTLILDILKDIYKNYSWITYKVKNFSDELFGLALNFWIQKICNDICEYGSMEILINSCNFKDESTAVEWLSRLIDYITKQGMDYLLDRISILPNQNGEFKKASELSLDSGEIEEVVKDVCQIVGYNIREILLLKDIFLKLPKNRTVKNDQFADKIVNYIRANKNKLGQTSEEKNVFQSFYNYLRGHRSEEYINTPFKELCSNLHWFYNDDDIAENMQKVEEYSTVLSKYGLSSVEELEGILARTQVEIKPKEVTEISKEFLAEWGISTEEELKYALSNNIFGAEFLHDSTRSLEMFNYVKEILERSQRNILDYLRKQNDYDISDCMQISKTIFVIKKHNTEIYLITRPSDCGQVVLYYDSEFDLLDYEKDCELWVEDGINEPQKLTFGKILKLTGVNKIPLRSLRKND
ncbi:sacsin N-terminal ATP-binding-like domain-containing protein [Clostridium sp. UBA6640]|uniref:sacsin N-terminal ATP-binding-like domain-containing protein n=1 Tax=Clostridium sp. UBA6640 TaxID=1946370 RepID=UPI0025C4AE04|nr:ATP-binding protein [Clostridium sp. UBA6640]